MEINGCVAGANRPARPEPSRLRRACRCLVVRFISCRACNWSLPLRGRLRLRTSHTDSQVRPSLSPAHRQFLARLPPLHQSRVCHSFTIHNSSFTSLPSLSFFFFSSSFFGRCMVRLDFDFLFSGSISFLKNHVYSPFFFKGHHIHFDHEIIN